MPDEPSNGELMRRLEDVRRDLKEDVQDLAGRLDGKVDSTTLALQQQAQDERTALLTERVRVIEEARTQAADRRRADEQRAADRRASDRRLIFTALIAPVLLLLLTVYVNTRGAGS